MLRVIIFYSVIFCSQAFSSETRTLENYAGTYSFGLDPNSENGKYGIIYIYPTTSNTIIFHLEVNRGSPSFNSGALTSELSINNNQATYFTKQEVLSKSCELDFTFLPNKIEIKTLNFNYSCGFGYNVKANGSYIKQSSTVPEYFKKRVGGEKVFFKDL